MTEERTLQKMTEKQVLMAYAEGMRDFSYTDLSWLNFKDGASDADSQDRVYLGDADFTGANLKGVNLSGALLRGAKFNNACLSLAELTQANLNEVDFDGANLSEAKFGRADVKNARFFRALLYLTDFRDVVGLNHTFMLEATIRGGTIVTERERKIFEEADSIVKRYDVRAE